MPRCPRCTGCLVPGNDPNSYASHYCVNCGWRALDPTYTLNAAKRDADLASHEQRWRTRRATPRGTPDRRRNLDTPTTTDATSDTEREHT